MAKAKDKTITEVVQAEQSEFARAFGLLESDICDLRRAAKVAAMQLDRAIDDMPELGEDLEMVELASYAVNHALAMAQRLEKRYYAAWAFFFCPDLRSA
jgi:hypothetical protein